MKIIKRLLLFIFLLVHIMSVETILAQEETLTLVTYYPAPFGDYTDLRANFYRDLEDTTDDEVDDPNTYFMDLDGRSWMRRLAIGLSDPITIELVPAPTLYVSGMPTTSPMSRATTYARMEDVSSTHIYSSIYGEADNVNFTTVNGRLVGMYGKASGLRSINRGVYGIVGDSSDVEGNPADYGVYGIGDEYGVRARGNMCGAYAYFGEDTGMQASGIYAHAESTANGEAGHGIYGITRSAPYTDPNTGRIDFYYGGLFIGSRRGVFAYSNEDIGIFGETNSNGRYGGYFLGHRTILNTRGGGILIDVNEGDSKPEERPEIVNGDQTQTIITTPRDATDYGRFTVFTYADKHCLAGVSAKEDEDHANPPEIYLKATPVSVGAGEDYTKYIVSSHEMEFEPGMADRTNVNYIRIYIKGDVYVGNDLVHDYSDLAEIFELTDEEDLEQGDVVVIDEKERARLKKSSSAYDEKVAGVISSLEQASMVMGLKKDGSEAEPLALAGRVLCKVDASYGEIKPGDFLVTSPNPGYAMKAEPVIEKSGYKVYGQGVILGKALEPLKKGKGKILILVCLM